MPTSKEQFEAINTRLDKIEQELRIRPEPMGWLRARWNWAINHKATSSILAVVLCLVGIFGGGYFKYWLDHKDDRWNRGVDDRIKVILGAKGGINDTLAGIQQTVVATDSAVKTLSPFIQDVIRHQFESASKLPTGVLGERLPAVKNLIAVAKDQGVKIEPGLTASLSKKLLQIQPKSPDYWQVSGALISYRSFNTTSWTPPARLRNCTDSPPGTATLTQNFTSEGKPLKLTTKFGEYRDCLVTLDSLEDGQRLNALLFGDVPWITFYRCVVVYRGGPVKIALAWDKHVVDSVKAGTDAVTLTVSGNALTFVDCLFDFSIQESSPRLEVQQLTRMLLTQNTTTIKLPLAPHS